MKAPRSRSAARARRLVPAALLAGLAGGVAALEGSGCQQAPVTVPVRSLEQSGKVSFVCLKGPPSSAATDPNGMEGLERDLSDCAGDTVDNVNEYTYEDDAGNFYFTDDAGNVDAGAAIPHLYALVTQTTRGEVAVVDVSARTASVLDQDPRIPGANFLPVGDKPVSIASMPNGFATFVATAEIGRPGIYVLPSSKIRPASTITPPDAAGADGSQGAGGVFNDPALSTRPIPTLSTWPACSLPSAPGEMILINSSDFGSNTQPKLVIAMPDLGGIVVIDGGALLDAAPGSFGACPELAWLPLQADLTGLDILPPPPTGPACTNPKPPNPPLQPSYKPKPAGMSYANGTLYVADLSAPVIHVIDMPTPSQLHERAPLLPTSAEEPSRVVTTRLVAAASAATPDLKQYLYASDVEDASIMVFDISPSSTSRRPLVRPNVSWNPFQPPDRIKFTAAPADMTIIQRDVAAKDPATGVAVSGVRCNPDPLAVICTDVSTSCDVGTQYQSVPTYDSGAGPNKLRGEFAFVALKNGKVAVIDIDDFDAPCRVPRNASVLFGCPASADPNARTLSSTDDLSCNVVMPHTPRDANYDVADDLAGQHEPGIQSYPQLYKLDGTQVDINDLRSPRMAATVPLSAVNQPAGGDKLPSASLTPFSVSVAGAYTPLDLTSDSDLNLPAGMIKITDKQYTHGLAVNFEDPRAHIADQDWNVTFEGAIPGFELRMSDLVTDGPKSERGIYDVDGRFCENGVLSEGAVKEQLAAAGNPIESAPFFADYVQVINELPDQTDAYWITDNGAKSPSNASGETCDFGTCLTDFGTADAPITNRDLLISEAYQDHVEVRYRNSGFEEGIDCAEGDTACKTKSGAACSFQAGVKGVCFRVRPHTLAHVKCCFPTATQYRVRAGSQWLVSGSVNGFLHHVVTDPTTGKCRDSCDPLAARMNGRAPAVPFKTASVQDGDKRGFSFINPMFRFAIVSGSSAPERDMQFRFSTRGSFVALQIPLATDSTTQISPVSITHLPITDELAITDGTSNGLIMVSLGTATVSRSFY